MKRAYYNYAIVGFETNENNPKIVDILFGEGKLPLNIFKKDAEEFMEAIISSKEKRERGIKPIEAGKEVETLNHYLKGRAMILITDFFNYFEFYNGGQNGIKEIAGLRITGEIAFEDAFDYESLSPSFEDLYPKG